MINYDLSFTFSGLYGHDTRRKDCYNFEILFDLIEKKGLENDKEINEKYKINEKHEIYI